VLALIHRFHVSSANYNAPPSATIVHNIKSEVAISFVIHFSHPSPTYTFIKWNNVFRINWTDSSLNAMLYEIPRSPHGLTGVVLRTGIAIMFSCGFVMAPIYFPADNIISEEDNLVAAKLLPVRRACYSGGQQNSAAHNAIVGT
jgi:hypothetical protein